MHAGPMLGAVTVGWGARVTIGRYLILTLPFVLLLGALLYFVGLDNGVPAWVVFVGPAAMTAFLLFLAVFQAASAPRQVRISDDGLVLTYGWPSRFEMTGEWKDWKPIAGSRLLWWVSLKYMDGSIWYPITPDQARAIFGHRCCPDWELPKAVQRAAAWPDRSVRGSTAGWPTQSRT